MTKTGTIVRDELADGPGRFIVARVLPDLIGPVFASAGLGALIGLIRQWSEQVEKEQTVDFGGVRTHTLWAILGCISAEVSRDFLPLAFPLVIVAVSAHLVAASWNTPHAGGPGSTAFAASLLTLFTGALVAWDQMQVAIVVGALTMVLLGLKQPIHEWTRTFTQADIRGTLQFVAVTGVILPLVPDRDFGPFDGFNLFSTWMMVVLISGLGFGGYVAMRLLGSRAGILVTSFLGGLASSTALTLSFAKCSRTQPRLSSEYALAVIIASTVMLPRVLVLVGVVNPQLAWKLAPAFLVTALPAGLYALWYGLQKRARHKLGEPPSLKNPLGLLTAIKFAALYAAVAFLVKAATALDWQSGVLPLSFVSGLTDTIAISLSMADGQKTGELDMSLAAKAVIVATAANSLLKAALAVGLGSPSLKIQVALVLGLTAATGAATLLFV
jgi:uncharacterized membrane protein (DUF4010 family)